MAYLGNSPADRFVAPKAASVFSGNGVLTDFTLDHSVGSDEDILVSVDGVIQEPSVAYSVSDTTLSFTAAPSSNSGNNIFVYYLFRTVGTVSHPSNNALSATTGTFSDDLTITDKIIHSGDTNTTIRFPSADTVSFETGGSERARVDSSGNFLVGKTASNSDNAGFEANATGFTSATRDNGTVFVMDRLTSDGGIVSFRKDNTNVGSIAVASSQLSIDGGSGRFGIGFGTGGLIPRDGGADTDGQNDIGASSNRFDDIRATNGNIETSDRNEKQDIEELTDAEKRVAVACKGLMRKYRWKDKVAEKGDDARTHFGIIAQDLEDAFKAEGLDASKYAMFCSDTWWYVDEKYRDDNGKEQTRTVNFHIKEEAPKDAIEKTRLGVRYSELLAFIISAI